jgi:rubredoxin
MQDRRDTHFFTEHGALCGVTGALRWTIVESGATCPACRDAIEAREQFEAAANARSMVLLGRIRGEP